MKKIFTFLICSLITFQSFSQLPSYVPTSGLKAWWSFNGNANDLSGHNFNGTVNGAVLTTDRFNNSNSAYQFDGINDWIDFGDIDTLNPRLMDITVSAWVNTTSPYSRIFSKGSHGGTQPGYAIMLYPGTGGKAAVIFGPGGTEYNGTRSNSTINDNTWHMVTGVLERNGNASIYIDGILQNLTSNISPHASIDVANNTYNATIGASYCNLGTPNSLTEFFAGKIDEVGVWRRALTQCEITQLYNESLFPAITVNSGSICAGNSFTIVPSGASTYTIEGGSAVVSPTTSTSYTVVGTNSLGCVVSGYATANVTVNPLPVISVNNGSICSGNSFTITPNGADTYTIEGGNSVVSPTVNTTYTVIGTSSFGCLSSNTATSNVTVNALPVLSVNSGAICMGNSFTMTPSGASTYTFSSGSAIVTPTATSSYSVDGTDANGCVSSSSAVSTVSVNPLPIIGAVSSTSLLCVSQTASLTASGANTYTWNTSSTNTIIAISPTVTTSYTVTGTDTNGCENSSVITQSVSACTGINQVAENVIGINIYPNPFNNKITIVTEGSKQTVQIFNTLGALIQSTIIENEKTEIDLSNQSSGVYFVRIGNYTKKLIKE